MKTSENPYNDETSDVKYCSTSRMKIQLSSLKQLIVNDTCTYRRPKTRSYDPR